MPTYVFECPKCGKTKEIIAKCADRDIISVVCDNPSCIEFSYTKRTNICTPMKRISACKSFIWDDIEPYFDENLTNDATYSGGGVCPSYDDRDHKLDGVFIHSRRQKEELMKRWGYEYKADMKSFKDKRLR